VSQLVFLASVLPKWADATTLVKDYGNWAVLAVIFAECGLFIGFFLPGDSLLFLAGFFSAKGDLMAWYFLLPALFIAAFSGDQLGYLLGSRVGPALFDKPDARIFKQKYVHAAHEYLEERGKIAVPLSRFVPIVRTFMPIVVGVSEIPYRMYFLLDAMGALVWAVGITSIGMIVERLANAAFDVEKYLVPIEVGVIALSLLPVAFEIRRKRRHDAAKAASGAGLQG